MNALTSKKIGRHDDGKVIPCCGKVFYVVSGGLGYRHCEKCGASTLKGTTVEILMPGSAKATEIA